MKMNYTSEYDDMSVVYGRRCKLWFVVSESRSMNLAWKDDKEAAKEWLENYRYCQTSGDMIESLTSKLTKRLMHEEREDLTSRIDCLKSDLVEMVEKR